MALSLYDASVANYLQTLGAVSGFLDCGLTHFREKGVDRDNRRGAAGAGHASASFSDHIGGATLPWRHRGRAAGGVQSTIVQDGV